MLEEIRERHEHHLQHLTDRGFETEQIEEDVSTLLAAIERWRQREKNHKESHRIIRQKNRDLRDTEGKLCSRITELEAEVDRLVDENNVLRDNVILVDIEARQKTADRANQDADTIESMGAKIAQLRSELKGWAGQEAILLAEVKGLTAHRDVWRDACERVRAEVKRLRAAELDRRAGTEQILAGTSEERRKLHAEVKRLKELISRIEERALAAECFSAARLYGEVSGEMDERSNRK